MVIYKFKKTNKKTPNETKLTASSLPIFFVLFSFNLGLRSRYFLTLRVEFCQSSTNKQQRKILFKCRGLGGREGHLGVGGLGFFLVSFCSEQIGFS